MFIRIPLLTIAMGERAEVYLHDRPDNHSLEHPSLRYEYLRPWTTTRISDGPGLSAITIDKGLPSRSPQRTRDLRQLEAVSWNLFILLSIYTWLLSTYLIITIIRFNVDKKVF
jgi:hypothetical protein